MLCLNTHLITNNGDLIGSLYKYSIKTKNKADNTKKLHSDTGLLIKRVDTGIAKE